MLFNSIDFLIFFPIVIFIYYLIPRKVKYIWLLLASYYFYMCWNAKYAILIAISTVVTYGAGILLEKESLKNTKKIVVTGSFVINLGILFFFKYFDFAIQNLNKVLGMAGISLLENPWDFLLPVGISFYTFQALGYTIDVYRGTIPAEKNLFRYALFVSFFPQLVAGPIERSKNLICQIDEMGKKPTGEKRLYEISWEKITSGFALMVWGLFMKMVIADRVAIFVDNVYGNIYACGTMETVAAAVGFSLQIYCDFAGYSAVAIGAARMMGFELMENFNAPYFATSIADFWRRWHISLSTWFRDYLYIPLGGNRKGKLRKYVNLMITFLVSGLWHGAAWHYVIWGGIHGLYQIVGDLTGPIREKLNRKMEVNTGAFSYTFGKQLITFGLTTFAWIFFRAGSPSIAFDFLKRMMVGWNPWVLFQQGLFQFGLDRTEVWILMLSLLVLFLGDLVRTVKKQDMGYFLAQQNLWFRWAALIVLVVVVLVYGEYGINFDSKQFIYFAF